jgi:serine/threonine-protein kinase HipA
MDGTVENEAFCMALAGKVGLDVPESFIHEHGGTRVFVVRRYDRLEGDEGAKRLHQEDFCQALGVPPEFKYESEGGPSLAACFDLLRNASTRSGRDVLSLLNWVIFNYLIGNSDAHGKNLSLLLLPEGPQLAPFYDLLSTRIYSHYGLADLMAMKIGGENDPEAIRKKNWEEFAVEVGVKPRLVLTRLANLAKRMQTEGAQLFKGPFAPSSCDALYRLLEFMGEMAEKTMRRVA